MRLIGSCCMLLLLSGLAMAQVTVIGGTASNWVPAYAYVGVSLPLVVTPSVTLGTVSPSAAGASNATYGNVAGATNATLSIVSPPPVGVFTQPVFYGSNANTEISSSAGGGHIAHAFDFIAAGDGSGIAVLVANAGGSRKASRTYTNQDADRMNDTNGMVKYRGKTEHI